MEQIIERRYVTELRAVPEDGIVTGTAIVFNSESQDLGGFSEIIEPSAATADFLNSTRYSNAI